MVHADARRPVRRELVQIPARKARAAVVALAGTVASESEARFMLNTVSMARHASTEADPVVSIDVDGRILVLRTRGGRVEVPAPVDYVVWTQAVKTFSEHKRSAGAQRTIRVAGVASTRAREGPHAAGWAVAEQSDR